MRCWRQKLKKHKKITTHIIAGKYKGRILELPSLDVTRSSKSILKESFFNVVQFNIIDTIFVEAFGGSGSIGLEAISRGAKEAYFIEIDNKSYKTLSSNCESIEPQSCHPIYGDTFEKLPELINKLDKKLEPIIIIYIDPPFDFREGMQDIYDKSFQIVEKLQSENIMLIAFEHMSELKMPEHIGNYKLHKTKKFGKSSLSYYYGE